jgi:hypothetical protein
VTLSVLVARNVASDGLWNGSSIRVDTGTLVVVATMLDVVFEVDSDVVVVSPTTVVDERGCSAP